MKRNNQTHSNSVSLSRIPFLALLRTLIRQKYTFTMLVLQIGLTLAVLSNGLFIVSQRLEVLQRSTGIDETNTFALTSSGFTTSFNPENSIKVDLNALRQMPNIVNAVATYAFPFSGSSDWDELQTSTGHNENIVPAASYKLDEHGIEALGLTLVAGENFDADEVLWQTESAKTFPSVVIVTAKLASDLFNSADWSTVVGKTIYINATHGAVVKGVVKQLQAPWNAAGKIESSIIYPRVIIRNSARYFIRTKPNTLQTTMVEVKEYLAASSQQRMIRKVQSIQSMKKQVYGPDIGAISILLVVISALSIVASLGIAGLTSFNLIKRKKQIGIRRALGANKTDILSYCVAENVIQSTCGVFLGWLLAIGLNIFLVSQYALPKLPLSYLAIATLCLYILGLLAILKPAIKAMNISPALATKD